MAGSSDQSRGEGAEPGPWRAEGRGRRQLRTRLASRLRCPRVGEAWRGGGESSAGGTPASLHGWALLPLPSARSPRTLRSEVFLDARRLPSTDGGKVVAG